MRYALLAPACALVVGAGLGHSFGVGVAETALPAALFVCLALIEARRGKPAWALLCVSAAACAIGAGWASYRKPAAPQVAPFPLDVNREFTGCVCGPTTGGEGAWRTTVELDGAGRMTLSHPSVAQKFYYGERISFTASARRPKTFNNPGSFDYPAWLAARGVYWQARLARKTGIRRMEGRCGGLAAGWIEAMRASALKRIEHIYSADGYRKAMMKGLLLGEASEVKRAWVEGFKKTGTYHALVISGSHVAFVAGVFLLYLRRFKYGETTVLLMACATAWTYALVAGGDPPVTRTAAGFTLAAVAKWHYRRVSLLHVLAAVAILFVALEPWQVAEAGFQLSFLAVAAIGALAAPWMEDYLTPVRIAAAQLKTPELKPVLPPRESQILLELNLASETLAAMLGVAANSAKRWMGRVLGPSVTILELFLVSAVIQLALALPMVLYFHRLSITGLSANVVATPLITAAIPVGFAAVLTGWGWLGTAAAGLMDAGAWIVAWHGQFEPHFRMPDPPLWLAAAFGVSSAVLAVAFVARRKRVAAFAVNGALLWLVVAHPFAPKAGNGWLQMAAIDVGQAECIWLGLPGGGSMLVDTGGWAGPLAQQRSRLDPGEDVVSPVLWSNGIKRLEVVAISHFHTDHAGGLPAVLKNFRPKELWTGVIPEVEQRQVRELAAAAGTRIRELRAGDRVAAGGVEFEVLAPLDTSPVKKASNDDSLVLRARFGRHSFLFTGDIEKRQERLILDSGADVSASVLKVAHHGSANSNLADFLDAARPAVALVSAAGSDWMRLPNAKVMDVLRARRALVLRTDTDGYSYVRSDGKYLEMGTSRTIPARGILLEPF